MKETYLTTNYLESSFSLLANVTNSANKPILQQLEGRVMTLDVIAATITSEINNNPKSGCVAIRSRKKRKLDEYSADDWNTAIEGCKKKSEEFHKKMRAKVKSALRTELPPGTWPENQERWALSSAVHGAVCRLSFNHLIMTDDRAFSAAYRNRESRARCKYLFIGHTWKEGRIERVWK